MNYYLTYDYSTPARSGEEKYLNGEPAYFLNAYNGRIGSPIMDFSYIPQMDKEIKDIVGTWKRFIRDIICGKNEEAYSYVRGWVAHLLRRPGEKNPVALCLRGESGVGKTVFFDLLAEMLGAPYCYRTDTIKDLRKNPCYARSLLVNFDNVDFKDPLDDWIKAKSENVEQHWNGKEIKVFSRYLLTTNDKTAFNKYLRRSRYFVADVSAQKREREAYFANLVGSREKKELLAKAAPHLYAYFCKVPLSQWDMRARSAARVVQETRETTRFKDYLYAVLKGRVINVYFWNANGFVFKKQIPWELYRGDVTPKLFRALLTKAAKRMEEPAEWLYLRFNDLAQNYTQKFFPDKLTVVSMRNNLQSIFGYNIVFMKVLAGGIVDEWFCVNRELALDWIS
jgi:hypothetical protein